jgi:AcrR family transcriptional regulator
VSSSTTRDARTRIVDAAERLLRTEGAAAVTTRAVAHAAGVQAPTLYRLFGDKDGLLDAVAEHVMGTYASEKAAVADAAARADADPVEELRAAWRLHVEFGLANPELFALIVAPGRSSRSPAAEAGLAVLRARIRRVAAAGRLRVDEQRALEMIHATGTGTVLALLEQPPRERDLSLVDAMDDLLATAVLLESPVAADASVVARAAAFTTVLPDLPALSDAERALMTEWLQRALVALRTV